MVIVSPTGMVLIILLTLTTLHLTVGSYFRSDSLQGGGVDEVLSTWGTQRISKRFSGDVTEDEYSKALDRINQRSKVLDKKINNAADVDVYVIGSGVSSTHSEIGERYSEGWSYDGSKGDCDGTGTAAASIAIGETLGIAREATVVPIKVTDCSGSVKSSNLRDGLSYVSSRIQSSSGRRAVVLVALKLNSDLVISELNSLARLAVVVIPAGDDGSNVCSRYRKLTGEGILIVGGSTKDDKVAPTSNYGPCLDIFAPGKDVTIAVHTDNTQTGTMSSTIYAAAAVAGVSAAHQSDIVEVNTVELQKAMIKSTSTKGELSFKNYQESSPNSLLFYICSLYKLDHLPKCYISQSMELNCTSVKSIVTFDYTSYQYTEHCVDLIVFESTATDTVITVAHQAVAGAHRRNMMPQYIIKSGSSSVELKPGPTVSVDGDLVNSDYSGVIYNANDIKIMHELVQTKDNREVPVITVFLNDNITVSYDGTNEMRVELKDLDRYYETTSGLCGFYDRSHVVEFRDKNGNDVELITKEQKVKFINEWKTAEHKCDKCESSCTSKPECQSTAEKACYGIKDSSGIFNKCHDIVDPSEWYERCVEAVKYCCCIGADIGQCKCSEEKKYWTAAMFDNCIVAPPCEEPCIKPDTHPLCIDDAGNKKDYFYRQQIAYDPKDKCHYVDAEDDITCKHDTNWNRDPSVCKVKKCDKPIPEPNSIMSPIESDYDCGKTVHFKCGKTPCDCNCYAMQGNDQLTCQTTGDRIAGWSHSPPVCNLKYCSIPTVPKIDISITSTDALSWINDAGNINTECCGGVVTFGCHDCYKLVGNATSQCCNDKWSDIPTCELKQCVDPKIEAATSAHLVVDTPIDQFCTDVITYSCDDDCYEIKGDNSRTCGPNGWEGQQPKCQKKKCPPLDDIDNGKYVYGDNSSPVCGDNLPIQCDDCHFPCSDSCERQCVSDGGVPFWNNDDPSCQIRKCRGRSPTNAVIVGTVNPTTECGQSTEANCKKCYKKSGGDNIRKCVVSPGSDNTCPPTVTDGVWSGTELTCQLQECPVLDVKWPLIITDTRCDSDATNDNTCGCVTTFDCDPCWKLNGKSTVTCDGESWDGALPTCVERTCEYPDPDGGRNYIPDEPKACHFLREGQEVTKTSDYKCGDILKVEAIWDECWHICYNDALECQSNGLWNITKSKYPLCNMVDCDEPEAGTNATLVKPYIDDKKCTEKVQYECKLCHKLKSGNLERTCRAKDTAVTPDGVWDGAPPVCEMIDCVDKPVEIIGGTVVYENKDCGSKATYTCDECKRLVGPSELVCEQHNILASWNNKPPTCEPICCPKLLDDLSKDPTYSVISTKLSYKHDPITVHVTKALMSVKDNYDICSENYVCQEMEARCDECYEYSNEVVHPPDRECIKKEIGGILTGLWTNANEVCKRKKCDLRTISKSVHHIHYSKVMMSDLNKCNDSVVMKCDKCYHLPSSISSSDHLTVTQSCTTDKSWSAEIPKCEKIECSVPADIDNGRWTSSVSGDNVGCGVEIEYTCDPCYRLVGSSITSCGTEADNYTPRWNNEPPRCEPICCEALAEPYVDDYTMTPSTRLIYVKKDIEITVDKDVIHDSTWYDTCKSNFVCQQVDAECEKCFEYTQDDAAIRNGQPGPPSRTCTKNDVDDVFKKSSWTNRDKVCTLKKCDYRDLAPLKETHHIHYEDKSDTDMTICNQTVTLECDDCYELADGSLTVTHRCTESKQWSDQIPQCKKKQCSTTMSSVHEKCKYLDQGNTCEDIKILKCDECYYHEDCTILNEKSLKNSMTATCKTDKAWHWNVDKPVIKVKTCSSPPAINHGSVRHDTTNCGGLAKYTCDRCYKFSHDASCLCENRKCIPDPADCTQGQWNETAPICEMITCSVLNVPDHVEIRSESRMCDGKITMECEEGYYLVDGDLERQCTESGTWTGKQPECRIKRCNPPFAHLANGQVDTSENTYGTIVTFSCDDCYEFPDSMTDEDFKKLNTSYTRHYVLKCESTGNWNGSMPACRKKDCGNPGVYPNMAQLDVDYSCRSKVKYQCNTGYEHTAGSISRTCALNSDSTVAWSGEEPVCSPVDCLDKIVQYPVLAEYYDTTYQHKITYTCGKIYEEDCFNQPDPSEGQCLASAKWSLDAPARCDRKQCSVLDNIPNGVKSRVWKTRPENDCGQAVYFACHDGYAISSNKYLRCEGGKWSNEVPSCDLKPCPVQEAPAHGSVNPSSRDQEERGLRFFGNTISYTCDECYKLVGNRERTCVANSNHVWFNGTTPICKLKSCKTINIKNGVTSSHSTSCGETVTFNCDIGFDLIGDASAKCLDSGDWSAPIPTCKEKVCDRTGIIIDNAEVIHSWITEDKYLPYTTVYYHCSDGYELIGEKNIYCQFDGKWSHSPPTCKVIPCKDISPPANGKFLVDTDSLVVVGCDSCYSAVDGERTKLRCVNGVWNKIMSECRETLCGSPGNPADGYVVGGLKSNYKCNGEVEYECDQGYKLIGVSRRRCKETGQWTGVLPVCAVSECKDLPPVDHAVISISSDKSKVIYTCNQGYQLYGDRARKCIKNQWTGTTTRCQIHVCGDIGGIQFGSVNVNKAGLDGGDWTYGAEIRYECSSDRYQLDGDDTRVCNENGWTGELPKCRCMKCDPLSIVNGMIVSQNERQIDSTIQYVCDPGYKIQGNVNRKCLESGEWDGTDPVCERIVCRRPATPDGGVIQTANADNKHPGQEVTIECTASKMLSTLTCQDDGTWSGGPINCNCRQVQKEEEYWVETITPGMCAWGHCEPAVISKKKVTRWITVWECFDNVS